MLIDECQDLTQAELSLLLEVAHDKDALYLCGDTAQTISRGEVQMLTSAVPPEKFKPIMRFLLSYVEKEDQVRNIAEKLCLRMSDAENLEQVRVPSSAPCSRSCTQSSMKEKSYLCLLGAAPSGPVASTGPIRR